TGNLWFFTGYALLALALSRLPTDMAEVGQHLEIMSRMGMGVIALFIVSYIFSLLTKRGVTQQ
ncbi:MAG TPA: hypothetical protein VHS59_05285, partial [Bacillota bacterium]|nr:hypothetical protein [Bacillota bacterium]